MNVNEGMASAWSPGSVGNAAVGFDILGHSLASVGDHAVVTVIREPVVRIRDISGCVTDLPLEPEHNTAGVALQALRKGLDIATGFELELEKGIPLGSGMGGSAASVVAALLAANNLLDQPLTPQELYPYALAGEAEASGGRHGDNIGPMLLGGLVLATRDRIERIPVPDAWHAVVVHPDMVLETRRSREVLDDAYQLHELVAQSANLALVLTGCFKGDAALVRSGLVDVMVEPRRAPLIPGFDQVKQAALDHGAMGASISGGGPSVFGWFEQRQTAQEAAGDMVAAFADAGFSSQAYVDSINAQGAKVLGHYAHAAQSA